MRKQLRVTILWTLLIAGAFVGIQALVANIYVRLATRDLPPAAEPRYEELINDGDLLAMVTVISGIAATLLTLLATMHTVGAANLRRHLGLQLPSALQLLQWSLGFVVLLMALELFTVSMKRPVTPDVMLDVYDSANSKLLLLLAVVVVAALFEEVFFRGFLLESLRTSFLGAAGSVLLTAFLWSVVHVQYDLFGMFSIFLIGVFLGAARLRTGSTLLAMMLHGLNNGLAFLALAHLSR